MPRIPSPLSTITLTLLALLTGTPAQAQTENPGIQEVLVRARDYEFDAPDVVYSGPTHLRLVNEGPDFHHVWLVRLLDGKTVSDLKDFLSTGEPALPAWAVDAGGPNTPGHPGEETSAYLDLKPGDYAIMCVIPAAADGMPHFAHGMVRALTVEARAETSAPMPETDLRIVLDDYNFALSRMITPGRHTIRVENRAAQAHEIVVVKLGEGMTAQDFIQWVGTIPREGAGPGEIVGGVTGLAQGEVNIVTLDFEPGRYALVCFVPDAGDGMPHFMHGMVQEFTVG
ncbi:MAG: hypothetical protein PVJ76_09440 [Gemmatimonadota bacterium]